MERIAGQLASPELITVAQNSLEVFLLSHYIHFTNTLNTLCSPCYSVLLTAEGLLRAHPRPLGHECTPDAIWKNGILF